MKQNSKNKKVDKLQRIEKLEEQLIDCRNDNDRMRIFIELAEICWEKSQYAKSREYAEQVLMLSKKLQDQNSVGYAYNLIGLNYIYLDNYDLALDYLLNALKENRKLNNHSRLADILNNIGQIYEKLSDYDRALDCFLESIKYNETYQRPFNNAGIIYTYKGDYEKALEYLWAANRISEERGEKRSSAITLVNIGDIYMKTKEYDKALKYFRDSAGILEEIDDKFIMISAYMAIGTVYHHMEKYSQALDYLMKAEKIALSIEIKDQLKDAYKVISETYEKMAEYKKAYEYYRKYTELKDKIYTDELSNKISEIQSSFEMEKKQLEAMRIIEKASRLASIGVIAAGITHEINQPLNAIKISTDSILFWDKRNPGVLPELFIEELKQISESSQRIDEIIKHMRLFWVNPEIDKSDQVELNSTLDNALSLISRQVFSHNIDLKKDICDSGLLIESNQIYIEQIIINLINNAIQVLDHCDKMGRFIRVKTFKKNFYAVIEIEDNGSGLPENIGDKLFDPFFSTKNQAENMGLGLAIVKRIVDRFKGEIKHYNNEHGGATFQISFPLINKDK